MCMSLCVCVCVLSKLHQNKTASRKTDKTASLFLTRQKACPNILLKINKKPQFHRPAGLSKVKKSRSFDNKEKCMRYLWNDLAYSKSWRKKYLCLTEIRKHWWTWLRVCSKWRVFLHKKRSGFGTQKNRFLLLEKPGHRTCIENIFIDTTLNTSIENERVNTIWYFW